MKWWLMMGWFLSAVAQAAPDVSALMQAADRARGGGLPGIVWVIDMTTRDADGEQRRSLQVSADGRSNDNVAEFLAPQKVRGQKLLMLGRNFWFVRPGLSKPVPISPRQRLLGDVSNGDVAATNYAGDYRAHWLRQEVVDNEACELLELTAAADGVTYDRIRYWVSSSRQVALKAEFYTLSGKLFKTARFEYANSLRFEGKSLPFVSLMRIQDAVNPAEISELRYREVRVEALSPSLFRLN